MFSPGAILPLLWVGLTHHHTIWKLIWLPHRVVSIVDWIPANHWRHVSFPDNPADLGSRGTIAGVLVLVKSQLWWSGPSWLSQPPDYWPVQKLQIQTTLLHSQIWSLQHSLLRPINLMRISLPDFHHLQLFILNTRTWRLSFSKFINYFFNILLKN